MTDSANLMTSESIGGGESEILSRPRVGWFVGWMVGVDSGLWEEDGTWNMEERREERRWKGFKVPR